MQLEHVLQCPMSIKLSWTIQWVVSEQCNLPENINTYIHTLLLSLSLLHTSTHTQRYIQGRKPYRLEDTSKGECAKLGNRERSWREEQ